ncbi:hypothetical protein AGDE_14501 [Angomonas deanei]|uniref:Uncharacterized protein n=1 Tax=Angomonas deanei TaxID=59799 RepID=A0A7G2CKN7_9TRYP|nr:hypothetical protein AGDE_14501 [Angomonas deanei]CAD2220428.1 hypothetical protein, conserved [Angomonas deanei]|eukprot:EPY20744.1 hypothetical protein AGDE_14501 [Angomonas deanei]
MVFAAVAGILCAFFMKMPSYMLTGWEERRLSPEEKAKRRATKAPFLTQQPKMYHFYYGFVILLILVIYLPITSALSSYMSFSTPSCVPLRL